MIKQEAPLSQRDRATRYVSKFVRYVSRGIGVRKVSNSKSDIHGHSRALAVATYDFLLVLSSIVTISLSCTVSDILSPIFTLLLEVIIHHTCTLLLCINQHMKFEVPIA